MSEFAKANLKNVDKGNTIVVCFNPKELSISKKADWKPQEGATSDDPPAVFGKPAPRTLSMTLYFDTYETRKSVDELYIKDLEDLTKIIKIDDKTSRPPLVIFNWGHQVFKGVITSLGLKYTMFLPTGVPVRCEASVEMQEASGIGKAKSKEGK